jgi:hypothetical protein
MQGARVGERPLLKIARSSGSFTTARMPMNRYGGAQAIHAAVFSKKSTNKKMSSHFGPVRGKILSHRCQQSAVKLLYWAYQPLSRSRACWKLLVCGSQIRRLDWTMILTANHEKSQLR